MTLQCYVSESAGNLSLSSDAIHGEQRARTRIVLNGACLLIIKRKKRFHWSHILLQLVEVYFDPNVETQYRIFSIEFWKVPIGYCVTRYSIGMV